MKSTLRVLVLILLALPLFVISTSCDTAREYFDGFGLAGEDGSDGAAGPTGLEGNTGQRGPSGLNLLDADLDPPACDQCVGNTSFADGAVGDSVEVADDAVLEENFAAAAVGTTAIADGSVGRSKLKLGAVTGNKIDIDAITGLKLGPDAVLPGNFATNAVEFGNIAPSAVDTQHFALGAANGIWTAEGKSDTQITPGQSWTPLLDLSMTLNGSTGGPYLVLFDASFWAQTPAGVTYPQIVPGGTVTPIELRLVMIYNGTNTEVLGQRPLGYIPTGNPAAVRENDLGHIAMHWAGKLDKNFYPLPHKFEVQWRNSLASGVPAQNITVRQRASDGTRTLTVIEFVKAATVP